MDVIGKIEKAKQKVFGITNSSDTEVPVAKESHDDRKTDTATLSSVESKADAGDLSDEEIYTTDKNFGLKKHIDTDKPNTWNILVRIISAKDVEPGSARVRVHFDGKQKTTRTVTHAEPKWRQNLLFTMKKQTLEQLSAKVLSLQLTHPRFQGEKLLGRFSCYLSEVIHSTDKSVIAKWVALEMPGYDDEESVDFACENCGFIKVSICVFRMDESPPPLVDDDGSELIWSGAHLSDYTLKIRFFQVEMLSKNLIASYIDKKNKKKPSLYIVAECGSEKSETTQEFILNSDGVILDTVFEQEMYLPIQWPTVISKIQFSLFLKRGKRTKCIGKAFIPMRNIYEPGEYGFLPTFGPSYLNFFDIERETRLNWFGKGHNSRQEDGSKFVARLFLSLDCVEYMGESVTQRLHLDHSSIKDAKRFMDTVRRYVICGSMHTLNMINPLFASDSIQLIISIGAYGSPHGGSAYNSSSTVGAMPNWDGCKYFAMPWGNMRPMVEVACYFENIEDRINISNALMKMSGMLDKMIWEILRIGTGAIDHVASVGCEAFDYLKQMVDAGIKYLESVRMYNANDLDRNWLESRKRKIKKIRDQLQDEMYQVDYAEADVDAKLMRTMSKMRDMAREMANDIQLSLPPVLIKMLSFGKLVGFAKIPIQDIFQSDSDAHSGEWCGRARAINLCWPTMFDRRHRREEFVAVLHAKLWFGRSEHIDKWKEIVEPAEMRYFMELYEVNTRILGMRWKMNDTKLFVTAEGHELTEAPTSNADWKTAGTWIVMNTHDMWLSDCGNQTVHDKAYEVQRKNDKNDWVFHKFTDFYGYEVSKEDMKKAVPGWELMPWVADKLRNNGDKNGWIYSTNSTFFGEGVVVDREAKPHHNFRRRCIRRARRLVAYNHEHEKLETFRQSLNDTNWEYSNKKNGPFHDDEELKDTYRRRRYIVQVEKKADTDSRIYRLYEYQLVTAKWQLRCYIMWAKDLLPVVKNSSRAFVRITFANHTKQTLLVDNSQNPIWNETVIFRSVLIAGGTRDIVHYPPIVSVEVVGECTNNAEAHLGRFETPPTVICSNTDTRAHPLWYPLKFPKEHTRGAVLACFELFEYTDNKDCLPLEPAAKNNYSDKKEIPSELRPEFDNYHVQFLCWGVRNLKKHQLLSVRRPFVELTIGSQEFSMDPLKDARKNPNFPEPMITFSEVALPSALALSPPFVVNLFDARAFHRRPLVGVCLIQDLHRYVTRIVNTSPNEEEFDWSDYNSKIDEQHKQVLSMNRTMTLSKDPLVPIDWWSRYYASMGQFNRAPGYAESGLEYIRIFKKPLEEVNGYANFEDFLDTFPFVKNSKGDFDDPEEKEKAGELKAKLLISKIKKDTNPNILNPGVEFPAPVQCVVRVYIIEATELVTCSSNGSIDPYVVVRCGNKKVNMSKNYRAESANPIFGERIELNVTIPLEKDLVVSVMDKKRLLRDEEIGSTKIDLENRLLTKWRATCGLSSQYTVNGELQWRDQLTPLEILKAFCIRMIIEPPKIVTRKNENNSTEEPGIKMCDVTFWYTEVLKSLNNDEKGLADGQREKAGKESEQEEEEEGATRRELIDRQFIEKITNRKAIERNEEPKLCCRMVHRETVLGPKLETIALFILHTLNLVPEHIETRPLVSDRFGKVVRGRLRMFVDIFPKDIGIIPKPFNITPRKPFEYEIRLAVMRVCGAIPVKRSFLEPVSDLYVKVFVNGMVKGQKTDTHFRVLNGSAEFNWRFVLPFHYNPWEQKVVAIERTRLFKKSVEEIVDPIIVVELWDKNKMKSDKLLGSIELDLLKFFEGIGDPEDIGVMLSKSRSQSVFRRFARKFSCCTKICTFCYETKCLCQWRKKTKKDFPKPHLYDLETKDSNYVNLFDVKNIYGWWPMLTSTYPHENVEVSKKFDDATSIQKWLMGLVEIDVTLVSKEEARNNPVGVKRNEPNHSPYLEQPARNLWDKFWILSRIRPFIKWFWEYYGATVVTWIVIILVVALFVYAAVQMVPTILLRIFFRI